jgi:hypothetical protein
MALDQYAPCPCGSGKKFKWCCLPIHVEIDKAYRQDADGQHEAALRTMDEVVAAHPTNPEALGRKAQLLYQNEKVDDAEKVLDQAFAINPNYPRSARPRVSCPAPCCCTARRRSCTTRRRGIRSPASIRLSPSAS